MEKEGVTRGCGKGGRGTVFWSEGKVPILVAVDQGATGWSRTKQLINILISIDHGATRTAKFIERQFFATAMEVPSFFSTLSILQPPPPLRRRHSTFSAEYP